ncbi:probable thiopurine S-methyltransferase isoform X2 [Oncorhynchus mykiss]|uniref:probable thiopurine S-methyltransferase isoform X2 n=1 Tax=Oncorhynchus mykiss TaxID=8022 RepID=UPI001878F760|nr:probable thiopurine S-methyltransferase isoform X2 [Oncorhynchus mykiss]
MLYESSSVMFVSVMFMLGGKPSWCQTNKMLSAQTDRVMALGEWEERWREDQTGWHRPHVNKMLESNIEKVLDGRKGVKFFFPLCGKALDMKWLADMGHSVVGVEIAEKAIKQFFEESNMTYSEETVSALPGAKVYKSSERNISLYQCDLYNFSRYAALITSLMDKDCRYLLDTLLYNPEVYKGPPFFVPDEQVQSLFGKSCDIELLQSLDALTDREKARGMDFFTEKVHLITLKTN